MIGQLTRFICTGIVNTVIDFAIFNLLLIIAANPGSSVMFLINSTAVLIAAANSYIMNRGWTFSRGQSQHQVFRFAVATAIGASINSLVVIAVLKLTGPAGLSPLVAANIGKILATVLSAGWNFFAYRGWVFNSPPTTPPATRPQPTPGMISIVVPAYNEQSRIIERLNSLSPLLTATDDMEIVVVNDGSTDNTKSLVEEYASAHPGIRCLSYPFNRGKGEAVRRGIISARGEYLIYVDADQTFTLQHINLLINQLQNGHPLVVACRRSENGQRLDGENRLRNIMGGVFNRLVQLLFLPGLYDSQCGLKGFHHRVAEQLFTRQQIRRFAFDVELLTLARELKIPVVQIQVRGQESQGSRVNCLTSPVQMLWDLFKIKVNIWTNRYELPGGDQTIYNWGIGLGLFALALMARLPWLWEVPRFIDELREVELGYLIYLGKTYPLHNAAHDIGALHNYILALLFQFFGLNLYLPRLYVAVTSAFTVVLLYILGRKLHSHYTGLLAAGLLITNGMHILVTHMAWSNCTTPFFFVLSLLTTYHAWERRSPWWLTAAGFLWGLTLQTHSSVIIYIAAVAAFILSPSIKRSAGWSTRTYLLAGFALMLGYANMIYYNLISLGGSFRWMGTKAYALETHPGLASYLNNLSHLLVDFFRTLSSTYITLPNPIQYLSRPLFIVAILLLAAGIILNRRNSWRLSIWLMTAGILIIPIFNQRYAFFVSTRYIMPLVLLAYLLIAQAIVQLWPYLRSRWGKTAVTAGILAMITLQLVPYYNYCWEISDTNASNRMAFNILDLAGPHSRLIIDANLPLENAPLPHLLALRRQSYAFLSGKDSAGLSREWQEMIKQYQDEPLVAVINDQTFKQLKSQLLPEQVNCLSCQVVIPQPAEAQRHIYVVEIRR